MASVGTMWLPVIYFIALPRAMVSCESETSNESTCELQFRRTVLAPDQPARKFCMPLTAVITGRGVHNCALQENPNVILTGLEKLDGKLRNVTRTGTDSGEIINACLMLDDPADYNGQSLASVLGPGNHILEVTLHFSNLYKNETCWNGRKCNSIALVTWDQPPRVAVEVHKKLIDNQTAVVQQGEKLSVCCGQCESPVAVSALSFRVTAHDPDWKDVPPTSETFKMEHVITLIKSTNLSGDADQPMNYNYTMYSVAESENGTTRKLNLDIKSLCEFVSVFWRNQSLPNSKFFATAQVLLEASVLSGVEPGYLLPNSTQWLGLLEFGYNIQAPPCEHVEGKAEEPSHGSILLYIMGIYGIHILLPVVVVVLLHLLVARKA